MFLERWREGEGEEEKYQCMVAFHAPPSGDLAHDPGTGLDWEPTSHPVVAGRHAIHGSTPARAMA